MKKMLTKLFVILAVILSDVMCTIIAYNYCSLKYSNPSFQRTITSVPASIAYLYAIPFIIGIVVCLILALIFYKKSNKDG